MNSENNVEQPKFQHDCNDCKYLGTFFNLDVYLCSKSGRGSIIARFGNDGPDYYSSRISVLLNELINPNNKINIEISDEPIPMIDWIFSEEGLDYYKAWVIALATLSIKGNLK